VLGIGQTLSHYEILEKIGRGGMGVVYKALDTRLNRLVAIKTLPPDQMADKEQNRRFAREAKSASALNHPNIVTIYEIGATDQVAFIAMEYVKGRTMKEVIPGNGLNTGQALKYAVQIADALTALHSQGIVHRDLKPANVMVGESSGIKVLDFGLAKLTEDVETAGRSILATAEQTQDGVVLGTLSYMSPEQVEGRQVDTRSDIFSFGVMLYEMITGRRPFMGENRASIAASILNDEPVPLTRIKTSVPSEIGRAISRCLEKDPQQRFQHAADLKYTLEWLARDVDSGKLSAMESAGPARKNRRRVLQVLVLALLPALLVIAAAMLYWRPSPVPITPDLQRITSDLGLAACPALSPDGNLLAYSSDRSGEGNMDIWIQQTASGQPIRRTSDPTDELSPNFSPDGGSIAFKKTGKGIFVMPTLAGEARQIAPSGLDPRFSPDGTQIVYWVGDVDNPSPSAKTYITALAGDVAKQIGAEFADARYPLWAPDGKSIILEGIRAPEDKTEWWVVPVAEGTATNTGMMAQLRKLNLSPLNGPGDWKGDYLAFSARENENRHIWIASIKQPGFRLNGPIRQLTFGTGMEADLSMSSTGRIAVSGWYHHNNLWRIPLNSGDSRINGMDRLSNTGAYDTHPSISADGKKLVFLSRRSGTHQVWIRDTGSGKENSLTIGAEEKSAPVIAPDGSLVAYSIIENGIPSIYVVPTDNSRPGGRRRVCQNCGPPSDWVPDLSGILYVSGMPQSVYRLDLASGVRTPILRNPTFSLDQPHISPDGCWVAFVAAISSDRARVYLSHLDNADVSPSQWIAVTDGQAWDDKPRWLDHDSLLYYSNRDDFGCLWVQRLKPDMRPAGLPTAVHHFHELRRSPRSLYRSDFEITATRNFLVLNLVELSGNIWLTSLPSKH
jgi:eukaryotic-like serine/threonine-protein kinase